MTPGMKARLDWNNGIKALMILLIGWTGGAGVSSLQAQNGSVIDIDGYANTKAVPISIQGYPSAVASLLSFHLEVVGFEVVPKNSARYVLQGKDGSPVQGILRDGNGGVIFSRRYSADASVRAQAHALADDVSKQILGIPGIGQTKLAAKIQKGKNSEICVLDFDGANLKELTSDSSVVASPAWYPGFPKSAILFYTSYVYNNPDIYYHNLATGKRNAAARYSGLNASPAISPDRSKMAMILSKNGSPDVYVKGIQNGKIEQITKTRVEEATPCWSPDGQKLCFVSRATGRPRLWVHDFGSNKSQPLQIIGAASSFEPDWSPDGKWIAFTIQRGGSFRICVCPAEGGKMVEITEGEDPSWAPNSRTLVFTKRASNGDRILSLLDVPTKRVKDIPASSRGLSQPSWSR